MVGSVRATLTIRPSLRARCASHGLRASAPLAGHDSGEAPMVFSPSFRHPPPGRAKASVFAVGSRVYIACAEGPRERVTLTDERGATSVASLTDGTEVDIVAWQPRGSQGTRYCVRSSREGFEGWLPAVNLRRSLSPVSLPTARPAPARPEKVLDSGASLRPALTR